MVGHAISKASLMMLVRDWVAWSMSVVVLRSRALSSTRSSLFWSVSLKTDQSVFLGNRSCLRGGRVVEAISKLMYLWSELENLLLTCQFWTSSAPVLLTMVRSMTELCPRVLRNVGVDPLFDHVRSV